MKEQKEQLDKVVDKILAYTPNRTRKKKEKKESDVQFKKKKPCSNVPL